MCGSALGQALHPARVESPAHYSQSTVSFSQSASTPNHQVRPQLKFLHPSQQNFLLVRESGVIGRQNLSNGMRPDIDLTGLPHAGVISRVHAHLYWDSDQGAYMIVDDSRNGSYLNDKLLARGAPQPLTQGDKLQLGQDRLICLQVELSHIVNRDL
jgi:pSer/pThr/pTyr-binding forkhead associated (FHA) protein